MSRPGPTGRRTGSGVPPTWSPLRFARQSALGHRRGQSAALVAVSALITACTAFAPVYDRAMQQALVDTLLARASPAERAVTVVSEATVDAGGATDARDPRDLLAMVPPDVTAQLGPLSLGRTASVTPAVGDVPPSGPLVWRDDACAHVRLISGTCPGASGEIAVSQADVDNFALSIGSTLTVAQSVRGQPDVGLTVVGTYAPRDETWWQGQALVGLSSISQGTEPTAAHDTWLTAESTFETPLLLGETSQVGALVGTEGADVDQLLALDDRLREVSRDVAGRGDDLHLRTDLDVVTDDVRSQTRQAHRTVPLLMAPVAVLALFVLWLVLAAATEQRRGEVAVARLRGRGPAGAVRLLLVELLPVLLTGVVPGAAAALLGGVAARALLPAAAPFEAGPGFALTVALAVVVVVLMTVAAAVRVAREPLDSLVRRGRVPSGRWTLGVLEAFLLAGVGTGVLAFVTGSLTGPFALAGPALLALLVGLLLAYVVAPASSAAGTRLLRRGHLVAGVTLLATGRRRETRAVIAVITVACALAVFAVDAIAVGERTRSNASEHAAGAPVVLTLGGRDLDGVRAAVSEADPTGHRASPVMIARTTLAVEPDGFRRIAYFPRGAPTDSQWLALAPPDHEPVELTGSSISLAVAADPALTAEDLLGAHTEVDIGLVVTTATGTRRTVRLGPLPLAGERSMLVGRDSRCAPGCRLAAVQFTAPPGVTVDGDLEISDLRVDGKPADWSPEATEWNTTEDDRTVITPVSATSASALRLELNMRGTYPAEVTPAWVPGTVAALLPAARRDTSGLEVIGIDGSDRAARSVGRLTLLPTMPGRSALVDLDAISRGAEITFDAHPEVWLVDDPTLVAAVTTSLRERGITVTEVRRFATIQQDDRDTVATWSLALGAVVGPAVLLLALLVLLVLAATGWRDRATDLAVLGLNGAGRRTIRRLAVMAQLPAVVLSVAAGIAAGVAGAALAMPEVSFFPSLPEVPVIDTTTDWSAVLLVSAACLVVLPAVAAAVGVAVARRAHPERVTETV